MAFVIRQEPTFKYRVKINEPENSRKITREIELEFRVKSPEEVTDLLEESRVCKGSSEESSFDLRLCKDVVIGWKSGDLKYETGEVIEFSEDTLLLLLGIPYARKAIVETYFEATSGGAKKGN